MVAQPRSTDAVGSALRGAFRERSLPLEIEALVRRLNEVPDVGSRQ